MSGVASNKTEEVQRIAQLRRYSILDTEPEADFDEITRLASRVCNTPISLVSLVDSDRQWFKSKHGITITETERQYAFCAQAILDKSSPLVVSNALEDKRFADNPFVRGEPSIRFYAGVPLVTPDGSAIGTLCVIDTAPKVLDDIQLQTLQVLAHQVIAQLELRLKMRELAEHASRMEALAEERAQQLIHAERLSILGTMCSGIAHEINNPMTFISGNLQLLERYWEQIKRRVEYQTEDKQLNMVIEEMPKVLQGAKQGVTRVTKIVRGLKTFSGKGGGRRSFSDINTVVLSALEMAKPGLPPRLQLELNLHYPLPPVLLDPQEIEQVLLNLLFNARDAMISLDKGTVRVKTTLEGGDLHIVIEDTGPGIDRALREQVWQPFFTTKAPGQGTGLGLAISKEIVEKHDGSIRLCDEYNEGTRFLITLPVTSHVA